MMNWPNLAMVALLLASEALRNMGGFSVEVEEQQMVRVSRDTGSDGSAVGSHIRPIPCSVTSSCVKVWLPRYD